MEDSVTDAASTTTRETAMDALREVFDPETGLNLVDLGLICGLLVGHAVCRSTVEADQSGELVRRIDEVGESSGSGDSVLEEFDAG